MHKEEATKTRRMKKPEAGETAGEQEREGWVLRKLTGPGEGAGPQDEARGLTENGLQHDRGEQDQRQDDDGSTDCARFPQN